MINFFIGEDLVDVPGKQTVHYANREQVPFTEIHFRIFPNILGGKMDVRDLTVDGNLVTPVFRLEISLMILQLAEPLESIKAIFILLTHSCSILQFSPPRRYFINNRSRSIIPCRLLKAGIFVSGENST